jgi:hypothetical protein
MLNPRILLGFLCITTPNYNLEWSIKVTPENTTTFGLDELQNNIINMTAIFFTIYWCDEDITIGTGNELSYHQYIDP